MTRKDDWQLARAELIDGLRTRVAYELRTQKRKVLNDLEADAIAEFDRVLASGGDYRQVVDDALNGTLTIRGELA